MARSSTVSAAAPAHELWRRLYTLASQNRAEFMLVTRGESVGWRWQGPLDRLIDRAAPGIPAPEVSEAAELLRGSGMLIEVPAAGGQPGWFIRIDWRGQLPSDAPVLAGKKPASDPVSRAVELEAHSRRLMAESRRLAARTMRLRRPAPHR